ncbi:hypothetical protein EJV47_04055 [Hymenobacter gummosus]|uniref:Lipocalin-like domain-containing protein n=1 Tax=Hymenobacter gummosus TaxID=1776032 RepID=A0A431U687_9BACT|nr:DUF6705 family protein [Hymenobacter gummosus]RTQ52209.1 hypothetical protein EJV47_04055 [Hymenobacter gummosus]
MLLLFPLSWAALLPFGPAPAQTPNPYVGAWEYRTDSTVFRIQLREVRNYLLPDGKPSPYPVMLGCYRFTRRGRVVDETCARPRQGGSPFGFVRPSSEQHVIFQDQAGYNHVKAALRPDASNGNLLRWTQLEQLETVRINDNRPRRFQLPERFELTRVE